MGFKIPKHLNSEFKALDPVARQEFIKSYRIWYESPFTQKLLEDLNRQLELSIQEEEKRNDFVSLFQSKYWSARKKAERTTLRSLINQLNPNID